MMHNIKIDSVKKA